MSIENSSGGLHLHVAFAREPHLTFDRAGVRRAFVTTGRSVQQEARRLVSRRAVSAAGALPGYRTGQLAKSVGFRVPPATAGRPGFMVRVAPNQKGGRGARRIRGDFYPAFLHYGVQRSRLRHAGWRLKPRKNFMEQALLNRRAWIERVLLNALRNAVRAE